MSNEAFAPHYLLSEVLFYDAMELGGFQLFSENLIIRDDDVANITCH